jgi:serine/threonine protein kinase
MSSEDKTELHSPGSSDGEVLVKKNDDSSLPADWMDQLRTVEFRSSQGEAPGTDGLSFDTVASRNIESHSEAQMKEIIRQALRAAKSNNLQGLQASRVFAERFKVLKKLGGGSYGEVYLVHDAHYNDQFALKIARLEQAHDPVAAAEDFLGEARAIMNLNHPGVMRVFEADVTDDGTVYMRMQYLPGGNLGTYVKDRGRLTIEQAVSVVQQIGRALIYIHSRGMVHRDLKPDNILFDEANNALIGDFGLVLTDQQFAKGPRFCGTMLYMSPEQLDNQADLVDGRSDIYSLGVLFYELLTGKHPYRSTTKDQLKRELATSDLRPIRQLLPTIPEELARIVTQAAAKKTEERYQTATDFVQALEAYQQKLQPARATLSPAPAVLPQPRATSRVKELVSSLLLAALIFGAGYWVKTTYFDQPQVKFTPSIEMDINGQAITSAALPLGVNNALTKMSVALKQPGHVRILHLDHQGSKEITIGSQREAKQHFEITFDSQKSLAGATQLFLVIPSESMLANSKIKELVQELNSLAGTVDTLRGSETWQEFSSDIREPEAEAPRERSPEAILASPHTMTNVPPEIDALMKAQGITEYYGWFLASKATNN